MKLAEHGEGRKRNLDEIANAAYIDENLIRAFFGEASAELANHGKPVLPPFLRLSTQEGVCVYAREKGTTPAWSEQCTLGVLRTEGNLLHPGSYGRFAC